MKSLVSAVLALLVLAAPVRAWAIPPIEGTGSCGGAAYSPGVYVFFFHSTEAPIGTYDVTAYEGNWAPDWAILRQSFNVATWDAAVTTNVGPTIWIRWSDQPATVFRIDAHPLCGARPSPTPTAKPTARPVPGRPAVTPPPTSTAGTNAPDQSAFIILLVLTVGWIVVLVGLTVRRRP